MPLASGAGHSVYRMHGAGGGGSSRGNRNAWKHGAHSAEALALKNAPEGPFSSFLTFQSRAVTSSRFSAAISNWPCNSSVRTLCA